MVSPVLNEQFYTGDFLVSQAEGNRSRQVGALDNAASADVYYSAGLVVSLNAGALTSSAGTAAQPANVGNGALSSISQGAAVQFGSYVFTAKSATDFGVVAPTGDALPDAIVGTQYQGPISLLISAGSTPFAAGDTFTVNVSQTAAGHKLVKLDRGQLHAARHLVQPRLGRREQGDQGDAAGKGVRGQCG